MENETKYNHPAIENKSLLFLMAETVAVLCGEEVK